jgi:hypothetical protein
MDFPDIAPCLVFPFEGLCDCGSWRFPALVFARRGSVVLFADERERRFGVGVLDCNGQITGVERYALLDLAAVVFLSRVPLTLPASG